MDTQALRAADRAHVWHPFTQMRAGSREEPPIIERGEGCDALRHRRQRLPRRRLVAVVQRPRPPPPARSTPRCARSSTASRTRRCSGSAHPPAIELAPAAASASRPPGLSRVFYSDNGSTAVEVALKMAFQYWQHARRSRSAPSSSACATSYHGDTLGSVSVGGIDLFHDAVPAAAVRRAAWPSPATPRDMARILAEHGDRDRRGDRRAAGAGRGGHARPPAGLPARGARAVRRATACC